MPVDVVHLKEIDAVGAQAAQRVLGMADDLVLGQPGRVVGVVRIAHRLVHLGRHDHPFAAPRLLGEPAPDDLFAEPAMHEVGVVVGGVEEVDARLQCAIHDAARFRFAGGASEVEGAQAQAADAESRPSQVAVLHAQLLQSRVMPVQLSGAR